MPRILRAKTRPTRHPAVDARAWAVAQELRARRGWLLDQAAFLRSWSVHLGAAAFEISAHVLLVYYGPSMVISLTCKFPKILPLDSASGRPGLSANFFGWVPRTNKRWTQFCDSTAVGLTAEGFRVNEGGQGARPFQAGRWVDGLSDTRALRQADEFDELLTTGADVVGG